MTDRDLENFDDPGLKTALRRVWGDERAPDALRRAVAASLHGGAARAGTGQRSWWWQPSARLGLAAAAVVLLACGLAVFLATRPSAGPGPGAGVQVTALVLPTDLAAELVARHDECCQIGDAHHMPGLATDPNNFTQVRQGLHQRLGFPILSAALPGDWHFDGASVCPVGPADRQFKSGHLVFRRPDGRQFVSLFSLSPNFIKDRATGEYATSSQGHQLAGFVTADGFYCVCGSSNDGSMTLDAVRHLRDQLRADVVPATTPGLAVARP